MKLIRSYKEISEGVEKIKNLNNRFITNFFLNETKITQWIEDQTLFSIESSHSIFILRKHMDFLYLYYISAGFSELFRDLQDFQLIPETDLVVEIVSKNGDLDQISPGFQTQGFVHHETLKRMSMMKNSTVDKSEMTAGINFASLSDSEHVLDFLLKRLDKYSEQIPEIKEIYAAILNKNILLSKTDGEIAGLLYFEKTGFTSHLKEWLVNEKYRNNSIGSKLIKSYFYLCENCNRFILWVKENNADAISKYEHYGYRMENLKDIIMVKTK
jgi:hypothetical protein